MAYTHDVHTTTDGTATGFITGFTLAVAALALTLVIGGIVLLAVRPWDNTGGGGNGITNNNNVPANSQPDTSGSGNSGSQPGAQ